MFLQAQPKSADAFYESLEKVVNELKSTVSHKGVSSPDLCADNLRPARIASVPEAGPQTGCSRLLRWYVAKNPLAQSPSLRPGLTGC